MNKCVSACRVGIKRSFVCPLYISLFAIITIIPTSHDSLYLIIFYFKFLGWGFLRECEIILEKPESFIGVWNLVVFR